MGTILPDGQAQYAQTGTYNSTDLRNEAQEEAVVTNQPGGGFGVVPRDQLVRDAYNPQQNPERGSDAALAADVQAHQPRLGMPDEELAEMADFTSIAMSLFGLDTSGTTEVPDDEFKTQITEDELDLEQPMREEGSL